MLLTPQRAEERVWQFVRHASELHATADDVARQVGVDASDAQHVLDEMVQRNELRRFDVPGDRPVYWS